MTSTFKRNMAVTDTKDDEDSEDEDVVLFSSDRNNDEAIDYQWWAEEDDDNEASQNSERTTIHQESTPKKGSQWETLHPKTKLRIIQNAQERAIANKKKREPDSVKQRRMMMYLKKTQRRKQKESRVRRPIPINSEDRVPLSELEVGMKVNGTVISITNFGAYVDVGTECDGLLHISQISHGNFVDRIRDVLEPGDAVDDIYISRFSPELKKVHLTMIPEAARQEEEDDNDEDRVSLEELAVDDELWGEIKRVTDYEAYIELGAIVKGIFHFMDHPGFGAFDHEPHPTDFMEVGQRVRVWISELDMDQQRIKLTGNRPVAYLKFAVRLYARVVRLP